MKFNIADPSTGAQKMFEIDDDKKCAAFYDRRMGAEVEADGLGDEFKGYIFKIMGGNDKQGFPMKQGVLLKGRTRLLMGKGHSTYRPRRTGERKRKSVRGCIVGPDIRAISLALVKKGELDIAGFTEVQHPRRLGPKRVTRIRKIFALTDTKKDDKNGALVKKNVIRRTWTAASGKTRQKAPKIQRLSTPERRRNRRLIKAGKKQLWENSKKASTEYNTLLAEYAKQQKVAERARKLSAKSQDSAAKDVQKKVEPKKAETKKPETKKETTKKPEVKKPEVKDASKSKSKAKK